MAEPVVPAADIDFTAALNSDLASLLPEGTSLLEFLRAIAARWEALDTLAIRLRDERYIESAAGAQLDQIGAIVGQAREGYSDEIYRSLVRTKLTVYHADGARDAMLEIADGFYSDSTVDVHFINGGYGSAEFLMMITTDKSDVTREALFKKFIEDATAGGVRAVLVFSADDDNTFTLDSGPGLDTGTLAQEL